MNEKSNAVTTFLKKFGVSVILQIAVLVVGFIVAYTTLTNDVKGLTKRVQALEDAGNKIVAIHQNILQTEARIDQKVTDIDMKINSVRDGQLHLEDVLLKR